MYVCMYVSRLVHVGYCRPSNLFARQVISQALLSLSLSLSLSIVDSNYIGYPLYTECPKRLGPNFGLSVTEVEWMMKVLC